MSLPVCFAISIPVCLCVQPSFGCGLNAPALLATTRFDCCGQFVGTLPRTHRPAFLGPFPNPPPLFVCSLVLSCWCADAEAARPVFVVSRSEAVGWQNRRRAEQSKAAQRRNSAHRGITRQGERGGGRGQRRCLCSVPVLLSPQLPRLWPTDNRTQPPSGARAAKQASNSSPNTADRIALWAL
jgi:hypothetical protein